MGKVDKNKGKSKAIVDTKTAQLAARRSEAIQAMASRGFNANREQAAVVEEAGLVDKADLVGIPFVILAIDSREGDYGAYVSVTCQLESDEIVVFNDGSTGIMAQLEGVEAPLFVPGGVRASNYTGPNGQPATTYYLSGRKPKERIEGLRAVTGGETKNGRPSARA